MENKNNRLININIGNFVSIGTENPPEITSHKARMEAVVAPST
jgi:hypothetical protein